MKEKTAQDDDLNAVRELLPSKPAFTTETVAVDEEDVC